MIPAQQNQPEERSTAPQEIAEENGIGVKRTQRSLPAHEIYRQPAPRRTPHCIIPGSKCWQAAACALWQNRPPMQSSQTNRHKQRLSHGPAAESEGSYVPA